MIKGTEKLDQKLAAIAKEELKKKLTKCALLVEGEAKLRCPVDTGQLRQSIDHEVHDTYAIVGTANEYAPYVENGSGVFAVKGDGRKDAWRYQDAKGNWHTTTGQQPQPFLKPALDDKRTEIVKLLGGNDD